MYLFRCCLLEGPLTVFKKCNFFFRRIARISLQCHAIQYRKRHNCHLAPYYLNNDKPFPTLRKWDQNLGPKCLSLLEFETWQLRPLRVSAFWFIHIYFSTLCLVVCSVNRSCYFQKSFRQSQHYLCKYKSNNQDLFSQPRLNIY